MASPAQQKKGFLRDVREAFEATPALRALVLANAVSQVNAGILVMALPFLLLSKGFNILQLGALFSTVAIGTIGVSLLAGRHQHVFGRRGVVLGLLFASVLLFPLYAVVETPLQFLLLSATSSFAGAAASPGLQVLIAEVAPPDRRATLFGYLGAASGFSYAGGLILAGLLMERGILVAFYVGAFLSFIGFAAMASFVLSDRVRLLARAAGRPDVLAETDLQRATLRRWAGDLRAARTRLDRNLPRPILATRNVRWLSLHLFTFYLALSIFPVYFPIFLVYELGLATKWMGVVVASSWITYALAQPFAGVIADRTGRHRTLIVGSLLCASLLVLVIAKGSLWWVIGAWVVLGVTDGLGRPVTQALIYESVDRAGRGVAFARVAVAEQLARILAPFGLALIVKSNGIPYGFLWVSAAFALSVLPVLLVRKMPAPPAPEPAAVPRGEPA